MNKENIEYISNHVHEISELSVNLLDKVEKNNVDVYMDIYNINQVAHKLRKMLDRYTTV